jgi:hypothetical protein
MKFSNFFLSRFIQLAQEYQESVLWMTYEQTSEVLGPVILRNKEYRLLGYEASSFSVPALYTVYFS